MDENETSSDVQEEEASPSSEPQTVEELKAQLKAELAAEIKEELREQMKEESLEAAGLEEETKDDPWAKENNPLIIQTDGLPPFIKGADSNGGGGGGHIMPADGNPGDPLPEHTEDSFDGNVIDPSTFTADS